MEFLADPVATGSSGNFILRILLNTLALFVGAYVVKNVEIKSFGKAIIVSLILAVLNATIGSILNFLAIPLKIITLGLFSFVIDAFIIMMAAYLIKGFTVKGFWPAFWLAILMAIVNSILYHMYIS